MSVCEAESVRIRISQFLTFNESGPVFTSAVLIELRCLEWNANDLHPFRRLKDDISETLIRPFLHCFVRSR